MSENIELLREGLLQVRTDISHLQNLKDEMDSGNKEIVCIYEKYDEEKDENYLSVLIDVSYLSENVTYIH